jgi:hypothetical protein
MRCRMVQLRLRSAGAALAARAQPTRYERARASSARFVRWGIMVSGSAECIAKAWKRRKTGHRPDPPEI